MKLMKGPFLSKSVMGVLLVTVKYETLKENPQYCQWLLDPFHYSPPHGETFQLFSQREEGGWRKIRDQILSKQIRRCALITNGGVVRYLLSQYAPN